MIDHNFFKNPLFASSRGFLVAFGAFIVVVSCCLRLPLFYKYSHVSQSIFSLVFLNFIFLYYLFYLKRKIKFSVPHYILLFAAFFVVLSCKNNVSVVAIFCLYLLIIFFLSVTTFSQHLPLFLSYMAVFSSIYSLGLFVASKLGVCAYLGGRITGNYGQSNLLATLMLVGLFSYIHLLSVTQRRGVIYLLPLLLISVVLFMTASRAGMVALCVTSLIVICTWKNREMSGIRPYLIRLFCVVIISWGIASLVGDWTPLSRAEATWSEGGGTYKRLVFWLSALLIGRDHLFTGTGFGGYAQNLGDYAIQSTSLLHLPYNMLGETLWAHNDFLHIFAEHGIVVFFLFIIFLFTVLANTWKNLSPANFFIFLGTISFITMMCFSHPLYYHNLVLVACLSISPLIAHYRGRKREISRKYLTPVLVVLVVFVNIFTVLHYYKMFELLQFRRYMVTADTPFTERYEAADALYLKGNIDDSIYGWQFKHTLYTNLVSRLQDSDNLDLAQYVLPDMVSYAAHNRFPSYLFSLAKLYYLLGDYEKAKNYASQAFERNPEVDQYFDLLHLCNTLLISRENKIGIDRLISPEDLKDLREQRVLIPRQFDSRNIAL